MCDAMYPLAPVTRTHSPGAILRSVCDIGVVGSEIVSFVNLSADQGSLVLV